MLKIYTEHQFLNEGNRRKVFPLLFDLVYLPNHKTMSNFEFSNSISDADVAIFPLDIIEFIKDDKEFLNNWIEKVSAYNIPIFVYAGGDFGFSLKKSNVINFRFGGFNSKLSSTAYIMPAFLEDPYNKILKNDFFVISKDEKPTIGFVGNANGSFFKMFKEFILFAKYNLINLATRNHEDYHPFYPSSKRRYQLLQKIMKSDKIQSNFIFRKKYRAKDKNVGTKESTTLEFFKNIQDNLYVFCLRGKGNFSIRLYEALIMGRIPVLVDTDVRLPLSDQIEWNKHCLMVSEHSIIRDLLDFHSSKTDFELKEMQIANRKLMLEKLNRIDYFIQFTKDKLIKK